MTLIGPMPPAWNQLYDKDNQPAKADVGYLVWQYAAPGTNPYVNVDQGGNINVQYTVNGSPSFNQPVQTGDWCGNLMLRIDPQSVTTPSGTFNYAYSNGTLVSEPALLKFQNPRFSTDTAPWINRLGISNPGSFGIHPTPAGPNAMTQRGVSFIPNTQPLVLGISGQTASDRDGAGDEITPLGNPGRHPVAGTDEHRLNVRVNHYSD